MWYLFKVNKKDIRTTSLTSGVFIVNFEQISHIVLILLLLVDFEQLNAYWVCLFIETTMQKTYAQKRSRYL